MRLYAKYETIATFNGVGLAGQNAGVAASNGYVTGIINHNNQTPFSEVLLLNFSAMTTPTAGKLVVRAWREEFSSFAFDSAAEGAYLESVTFAAPYGYAPIIAEIPFEEMLSGGQIARVIKEIDIGAGFNKNIPNKYRLIFENSTNAALSGTNLRFSANFSVIRGMYVETA